MTRILAVLAVVLLPLGLAAQTYPERSDTHVVDLGEMIPEQAEGTLRRQLAALLAEDETEMAIVTLPSIAEYAGVSTVEEYANGLLDAWALGDAERNDGILLVVFAEDRELWLALGAGYDGAWNGLTAGIIQYRILPAFRDGDPALGLSLGIDSVRAMIVQPFRADQPVPDPITAETTSPAAPAGDGEGSNTGLYIIGGIVAAIAALIGVSARRRKARLGAMVCESCGNKGLEERSEVVRDATETEFGERAIINTCPKCGHETRDVRPIPKVTPDEPDGGKSGGGGAGGSW